ncbi:hypothetical protein PHLGIDRAFT_131173 [Phlebiopsis gigantea 11061_1 CR5-6]|uniref:DUF6533 domain-containing protein n=1 Tax=Phlebiopsis gigantea (strain 11061_1 CR5-6) TaxID=745531 RepID=A0A0C3NAV9_PHLG1|nr:hypothetical protein PHLGIDRAFT_131173 [Phlebiopsis gigantea 11061_1 CR5-6]
MNATVSISPALLDTIQHTLGGIFATKYLSGSAVTLALWDHLCTSGREIETIWSRRLDLTKAIYLLNRWGVGMGLIYAAYVISGFRQNDQTTWVLLCEGFSVVILTLASASSLFTNVYMVFYYYGLWERSKVTMTILTSALILCYVPAYTLLVLTIIRYRENTIYYPRFNACVVVEQQSVAKGFWGCLAAFDIAALSIGVLSSFGRPYRQSADVLQSLRRDGAIWFTSLFLLRLLNLVIAITIPSTELLITILISWALINATACQFVLRVEGLKIRKVPPVRVWNVQTDGFELGRWSSNGVR